MATKAQFTLDSAKRIGAVVRRVEAQGLSLSGQQQPTYRVGLSTPHLATAVSTTGITVGLGRGLTGRAPERVYISHRGAIIEIAKGTAEALTGITASGYVVYEVVCTAGTWTATAAYSTTLTALTDAGKIYVVIAKVTCTSSVITAIYQQLWDNPTVHIGSPQYSITVNDQNGRLQLLNDQSLPPPMSFYGTNQFGILGYHPLCPLVDSCAGGDPEGGQPCGDCDALPNCYQIDSFADDMFDPASCSAAAPVTGTLWDGKLTKTSSASEPCLYSGEAYMEDPNDSSVYKLTYMLFQYLDDATCTWRLQLNRLSLSGSEILWYGDHTGTDPDDAAFTRVGGCDSTATITLTLCLRTIRLTISGMVRCCSSSAYKPDSVAMLNGTWDIVEDGPGAGTWTLAFGSFESWNLETWDTAACTGAVTSSAAQDLNVQVTYDGATTWHIDGANDGFNSVFWIYGDDTGGDATGGTIVSIYACGDAGDLILAAGGTATIEVL